MHIDKKLHENVKKYVKENDIGTVSRLIRYLLRNEIYNDRAMEIKK